MQTVYVYRSGRKQGMYLFLPEKDRFEHLPDELCKLLGELHFSFEFSLDEKRKLIRATAQDVLHSFKKDGYFLQLPPAKFVPLEKREEKLER